MRWLFSLKGRVPRSCVWLVLMATVAACAPFGWLDLPSVASSQTPNPLPTWAFAPAVAWIGQIWIVNVTFLVRRCHDRNSSGLMLAIWLMPLVNIWGFIELYCLRGTVGGNDFGPDPLAPGRD